MTNPIHSTFCALCGSQQYSLMHRESSLPVKGAHAPQKLVQCLSCKLVYALVDEAMAAESLRQHCQMLSGADYASEEAGRRIQAKIILGQIAKHRNYGALLHLGEGSGFFLDEAKKIGYQPEAVDLQSWVHKKKVFDDRAFDVIVVNDVIQFLPDPKQALHELRRILKNDGVLYLSTPDIESTWSRFLGARWWGIKKNHLCYFSKETLGGIFKVVGFKPAKYYSYTRVFSLKHWADRLKSYPALIHGPLQLIAGIGSMSHKLFKVTLHDQVGVVLKKIQRLDSVIVDEIKKEVAAKKQKVVVVLPAYNAEKTLERTVADIPKHCVDEIILVDDCSRDKTVEVAHRLGLTVVVHKQNRGYGGNQKTCYQTAIDRGADVAVMCHPDYQYDPKVIPHLIEPILRGEADAVFGSRMMKGGALEGGMPLWKHNANILLTALENVVLGTYLTEYHTGFRAYSTRLLKHINLEANSDNFIFDTEIIAQILANHFKIEEVPIRTRYFEEASSIKLWPSIVYGCGILRVMLEYVLHSKNWIKSKKFLPRS